MRQKTAFKKSRRVGGCLPFNFFLEVQEFCNHILAKKGEKSSPRFGLLELSIMGGGAYENKQLKR
jgi:hypothetical protein